VYKIVILTLLLSFTAQAEVIKASGKVKEVWLFSKNYTTYNPNDVGLALIYMGTLTGACDTGYKRIAISTDHSLYQSVVSTALTAKTTGATITLWHLSTCNLRSSAWDFGLIKF